MRKLILKVSKKLRLRFAMFHTWLLRSSFESIGKNVRIDFPNRIEEPGSIAIGNNVGLYSRSWLNPVTLWCGTKYDGKIRMGDGVRIGYGCQISAASSITIDDDAAISSGVVIMDHMHDYRYIGRSIYRAPISEPRPVYIGKRAFLGAYCFIGPGVQIGEQAVVGANVVVTKDVPAYCVAVGNPARILRYHDPAGATLALSQTKG
jgi:acetyltransferase-like isoleucine patch superfamily enzyme